MSDCTLVPNTLLRLGLGRKTLWASAYDSRALIQFLLTCFIRDTVLWCLPILFGNELIDVFSCSQLVCPDCAQFDADRNEDEVFYDISMAVDSKLFPNKEAAAGKSLCPSGHRMAWPPAKCLELCSNIGAQQSAVRL